MKVLRLIGFGCGLGSGGVGLVVVSGVMKGGMVGVMIGGGMGMGVGIGFKDFGNGCFCGFSGMIGGI